MERPFVHMLDEEIRSISGYYVFRKEGLIEHQGRSILYLVGEAEADSACCGRGGCRYILVPGVVINWKVEKDEQGRSISRVEPLSDPVIKEQIRKNLMEQEGVPQVQFW